MTKPDRTPVGRVLEQARAEAEAGRPEVAELLYRTVLVVQPQHPGALAALAELASMESAPAQPDAQPGTQPDAQPDVAALACAPRPDASGSGALLEEKKRLAGRFMAGDFTGAETYALAMTKAWPEDAFG